MCHGGSALLANIIWGGSNLLARVIWGTNNASIINPPGSKNTRIDFPVTPAPPRRGKVTFNLIKL